MSSPDDPNLLPHRNRYGEDETRDIWIRSQPVKNLIRIIFGTLGISESLPDLQLVSVGKFILSTLIKLKELNQLCQSNDDEDCTDLIETSEMVKYLEIFDKVFLRIVKSNESSESKKEIIDMVWQYHNEGILDFSETTIPQLLVSSMSLELLQEKVLDSLTDPDDKDKISNLLSVCAPPLLPPTKGTLADSNFTIIMNELASIFHKSEFHSTIISFTRNFVSEFRKLFPMNYLSVFPTYMCPVVLICDFLYSNNMFKSTCAEMQSDTINNIIVSSGTQKDKRQSSETIMKSIYTVIFKLLNEMYNPCNIENYASFHTNFDEHCISFYISTCCPQILEIIQSQFKSHQISFKNYPFLWKFLTFKNSHVR